MEARILRPERSYADRIELLGLLVADHPYPEGWADQRAGILLQTKWQDRSGRAIADEDGRLGDWWPTANWSLTVWQLEALKRRGERPDFTLAERTLALPDDVAESIVAYYDRLDAVRLIAATLSPDERRDSYAELQRRLWEFHVRAISHGLVAAAPRLSTMPPSEARFAESWGECMVGLLAAVNFPTEHETVRGMQRLLPSRILTAGDWDPAAPSDLSEPQRSTLYAMRSLYEAERDSGGRLAERLARMAATPAGARAAANLLFEALALGGAHAAQTLDGRLSDGK